MALTHKDLMVGQHVAFSFIDTGETYGGHGIVDTVIPFAVEDYDPICILSHVIYNNAPAYFDLSCEGTSTLSLELVVKDTITLYQPYMTTDDLRDEYRID